MLEGNTSFALQSVSPSLTPSVKYRGSKPLRKRNKCISLSSSSHKAPPGEKRVEKKNAAMFQSLSWPQLRHMSLQKQITMETLATLLLHFLDHQPRQHKILCSFTETNNNANLRHRHTVMKWKNGQAKKVVSHIIYKRWGEKRKKKTRVCMCVLHRNTFWCSAVCRQNGEGVITTQTRGVIVLKALRTQGLVQSAVLKDFDNALNAPGSSVPEDALRWRKQNKKKTISEQLKQ